VDEATVNSEYSLEQAIADGVLVEVFQDRWKDFSSGKPIVATSHLFNDISPADLMEIWNRFTYWKTHIMPNLPEEDQLFSITMNGDKVWVIEDGLAITMMYPEDY
jgi:hypothetical protein